MVNKKIESNKLYYIIIVFIVIVVLYLIYMLFNKRTKLYESYKNSGTYKSGISKDPMKAYNHGFKTGKNSAIKEIDNAIKHTKNEKCINSAFYTWGRINGLASEYENYLQGDKFGKACNNVEGSKFKDYITVGYRLQKI